MTAGRGVAFAAAWMLFAAPAWAQQTDRWVADETDATAMLPRPRGGDAVTAASLSCAVQRWTLELTVDAGTPIENGEVSLVVDKAHVLAMSADGQMLSAPVPREALEPLRQGVSMKLDFSGVLEQAIGDLAFSLRGSQAAIDAVAARCSVRDMTGYTPVTFTPYSSYMNLARELRKDDVVAFVQSTASEPKIDAAMVEFGDDRRVLFTRICGSSWYFGTSGCNVTGFAPGPATADGAETWLPVYDSEHVHLYTDPRSVTDGWPDVVSLPIGSDGVSRVWRWSGDGYAHAGELPDEDPLPLRAGQD